MLLISERNGALLCEYYPPQRCSDTALEEAVEAGYAVMVNGFAAEGQHIWQDFYGLTQQGKEASVTVAYYYDSTYPLLSSVYGYYQIFRQDYPNLEVWQLHFDGSSYTLSMNGESKTYEYLMKYGSSAAMESDLYVLTHDNRVTYDELWQSAASSQYGAYIDHFQIYSERKTD